MKLKPVFTMSCVVAAFAASPSLAGSPDDPGLGGWAVQYTVEQTKLIGDTWGEVISNFVHTEVATLGSDVSAANAPNPANDNGGGNTDPRGAARLSPIT